MLAFEASLHTDANALVRIHITYPLTAEVRKLPTMEGRRSVLPPAAGHLHTMMYVQIGGAAVVFVAALAVFLDARRAVKQRGPGDRLQGVGFVFLISAPFLVEASCTLLLGLLYLGLSSGTEVSESGRAALRFFGTVDLLLQLLTTLGTLAFIGAGSALALMEGVSLLRIGLLSYFLMHV